MIIVTVCLFRLIKFIVTRRRSRNLDCVNRLEMHFGVMLVSRQNKTISQLHSHSSWRLGYLRFSSFDEIFRGQKNGHPIQENEILKEGNLQTDVKRLRPLGDVVLTRVKCILTKFLVLEFAIQEPRNIESYLSITLYTTYQFLILC